MRISLGDSDVLLLDVEESTKVFSCSVEETQVLGVMMKESQVSRTF
jgi:hypothetical protein